MKYASRAGLAVRGCIMAVTSLAWNIAHSLILRSSDSGEAKSSLEPDCPIQIPSLTLTV